MKQQLNQELLVLCENLLSNSFKLLGVKGVKGVLIDEKDSNNNNTGIMLGGSTPGACWFHLFISLSTKQQ
jgi:hypothetical protein